MWVKGLFGAHFEERQSEWKGYEFELVSQELCD